VSELIERYFSAFLDEVAEHGGNVNETMGDGFMAIFRHAEPADNALQAAETAVALLAATGRLNSESRHEPIAVHIGIASGLALVGSTQFEGRHGARWVFSASGRAVNLAARLAGVARAGQILASDETARRLGDRYTVESEGKRQFKNIEEAVEIFRIVRRA
jgi:class 3 adenylate cyclase